MLEWLYNDAIVQLHQPGNIQGLVKELLQLTIPGPARGVVLDPG
jgi:hypothetical protein